MERTLKGKTGWSLHGIGRLTLRLFIEKALTFLHSNATQNPTQIVWKAKSI
jgi:hypothetical protein